jgi:predicted RNA-binding protein YlqC (UPF0109 family)
MEETLGMNGTEHTQPETTGEENKQADMDMMEVRILIDNIQVGGIIGRKGANVKSIRENTGVYLSILKSDFRNVQERVMILKGALGSISVACHEVAKLMVESTTAKDALANDSLPFRLLVHKAIIGAIIGKGGQTIKDLQASTSTRIQISTEPLQNSHEKSVTIFGTPASIEAAMTVILKQLKENPLKPGTKSFPYVPGVMPTAFSTSPSYMAGVGPQYGMGGMGGMGAPYQQQPQNSFGQPSTQGPSSTQKIAIPTVCAGCVIGKGGAVIRDIRLQSATTISIADPDEITPSERVVTIAGSPSGIQAAIYLIRQLVEQYQPPPQVQQASQHLVPSHQTLPMQNDPLARAMGGLQIDPYQQHPQY